MCFYTLQLVDRPCGLYFQGTELNSGDLFYQFQPYYCHPLQVSSLVLPRVYLASDFMALLEELDDEIGQQLAEM